VSLSCSAVYDARIIRSIAEDIVENRFAYFNPDWDWEDLWWETCLSLGCEDNLADRNAVARVVEKMREEEEG